MKAKSVCTASIGACGGLFFVGKMRLPGRTLLVVQAGVGIRLDVEFGRMLEGRMFFSSFRLG